MHQKLGSTVPDCENLNDKYQQFPPEYPWTITSIDDRLTVIITCLNWTFNYNFWIRVTAHAQGDPNTSEQIVISEYNFLLKLPSEAPYNYDISSEHQLNS